MNKLNNIEKKNPFRVPDGYFEEFNKNIMERLPEKEQVATKVSLWKMAEPWLYLAAMFVGGYLMIQVFMTATGNSPKDNVVADNKTATTEIEDWSNIQISEEEFYQYLEEQLVNDGYYDYVYNEVLF